MNVATLARRMNRLKLAPTFDSPLLKELRGNLDWASLPSASLLAPSSKKQNRVGQINETFLETETCSKTIFDRGHSSEVALGTRFIMGANTSSLESLLPLIIKQLRRPSYSWRQRTVKQHRSCCSERIGLLVRPAKPAHLVTFCLAGPPRTSFTSTLRSIN